LERLSGVKLFNRVGRGIELTEAGRRFLPEAKSVLERAKIARAILEQAAGMARGTVSIGASQTIANHWLPRRLAAYHEAYPGIRLDITIGNTQAIEKAVVAGTVDVGLVEGPTAHGALIRRVVDTDRSMLVVSTRSAVQPVTGGRIDLEGLPWVIREEGSGTRHVLEELCKRLNVPFDSLRIVLVLPSNEAVREAVEAGAGVTIISEQVAAASVEAGRLRAIPLDLPEREFALLRHSERVLAPAQRALVDALIGH
jgi:DNA-binding transcriptional LysR family regulator